MALTVPVLALLDFADDCVCICSSKLRLINLIVTSTVLHLLSRCGVGCWNLIFWPRRLLLSFIRQLLFLHRVAVVLAAGDPDGRNFCRHADYTYFVFMLCLPYLALINSAAEKCGLVMAMPAIAPLDSEAK